MAQSFEPELIGAVRRVANQDCQELTFVEKKFEPLSGQYSVIVGAHAPFISP